MRLFQANIKTVVVRFYLMMGVIILAGFIGQWWLGIIGFGLFISALLGARFATPNKRAVTLNIKRRNIRSAA